MSDDSERMKREAEALAGGDPEEVEVRIDDDDEGPVETPFDHPLFLPIILAGLSLWFFYDGFINQDPEMLEHLAFNRGGFAVLSLAAAWFGYKGWREMREDARDDAPDPNDNRPIG